MEFNHYSVLLKETIEGLNIKPDGIYLDGTLGGGGHSEEILKRLTTGHLYGTDRDEDAIRAATERLEKYKDSFTAIKSNYKDAGDRLEELGINELDGIVLDLGVSSYQFDMGERGFSYRFDAPLDMRMDREQELSAREIVNDYPESELYRIIRDYGEDKFAKNIAKHIVKARSEKSIETTFELNEIIKAAIPAKMRRDGHPSKQTYQAIRIECNSELESLKEALEKLTKLIKPGGRMCIITFHSLEDRIVKSTFKRLENPCTCPPDFPICVCGKKPEGRIITKKAIIPDGEEIKENKRSSSAKLRILEKL